VKKRVERSQQDPSTVITTYEGQHTHQSPLMSRLLWGTTPRSPLLMQHLDGRRPDLLAAGTSATATSPMHLLRQEHRR